MRISKATVARFLIAMTGFTVSVCLVFYIGFVAKFQPSTPLKNSRANTAKPEENTVFYKSIGHSDPKIAKHEPTGSENLGEKFTLELKVVTVQADAEALVNQLRSQGFPAYYTPFQSRGRVYFRVRQGVFSSKDVAESEAHKIKLAQKLPVTVVKLR